MALGVLGVITGMFSALTGLGGGVLMVPTLHQMGVHLHRAVGTSSAVIGFMALGGAATYTLMPFPTVNQAGIYQTGAAIPWFALMISATAVFSTAWGVKIKTALSQEKLGKFFGAFLLVLALRVGWVIWHG